jgi:ankyrin repeat protein
MELIDKLTTACFDGKLELVKEYLKLIDNIDSINRNRETPLACAIQGQSREVIKHLVSQGADINFKCGEDMGYAPIHIFVSDWIDQYYGENEVCEEDFDIIELLLSLGADINSKDKFNDTVLDYVISYKNPTAIRLLRNLGAKSASELD